MKYVWIYTQKTLMRVYLYTNCLNLYTFRIIDFWVKNFAQSVYRWHRGATYVPQYQKLTLDDGVTF